jgi:hypothetical protein
MASTTKAVIPPTTAFFRELHARQPVATDGGVAVGAGCCVSCSPHFGQKRLVDGIGA